MFPSMAGALLSGLSTAFDLLFTYDCSALSSFVVGEVYRTRDGREARVVHVESEGVVPVVADVETFVGSGEFVRCGFTLQGVPLGADGSVEEDDIDSYLTALL